MQHHSIYVYESNVNCFVVDYKNKKAKALKCSRLESASELKAKDMVPPTIGDIPNPFEELLK
ncbi:hypothetical protein LRZ95_00490 [Candidatus Gracilibacteria bacterium]|nr:hypothetical protein [Candidatus Gracilibacteria bacterium]